VSRSLAHIRLAIAVAAAAALLVFAAPAMAAPQPVLPSGHHTQTSATVAPQQASVASDSDTVSWNGVVTVVAGALLGAGLTLGAMTLWRRHDQQVSAA
jgi:hypothetical protein